MGDEIILNKNEHCVKNIVAICGSPVLNIEAHFQNKISP